MYFSITNVAMHHYYKMFFAGKCVCKTHSVSGEFYRDGVSKSRIRGVCGVTIIDCHGEAWLKELPDFCT